MKRLPFFFLLVMLGLIWPSVVVADPIPIIQYQAIDLPDQVAGEDLWQYQYTVSYATADKFKANQAFAIFFDFDRYKNLEDLPPAVADWFTLVFQPDAQLPAPGEYDALALKDDPSLANPFGLTFVWQGVSGAPGSQPFTVIEFDDQGNWLREIGSGRTIPTGGAVPEPGTLLLIGIGLAALAAARRKKR